MISLAACAPPVTASGPSPAPHSTSSATPSARGPVAGQSAITTTSQALKALGSDINVAPDAGVWDGRYPAMGDRSHRHDAAAHAQHVTAAIAGIHAAGMDAAVQSPGADLSPL